MPDPEIVALRAQIAARARATELPKMRSDYDARGLGFGLPSDVVVEPVSANGVNATTASVASMDGIVSLDFKNDLPVVITKTIAATVVKAVAAYAANDAARQAGGDLAGLLTQVATAAYEMAVNIADTRTWTTLPKEFQVCRIPTPADGKLELVTATGIKTTVTLAGAGTGNQANVSSGTVQASLNSRSPITVVYVKSISATSPLLVTQLKLK